MNNKDLYKKAIEKFGIKSQINIFCEECSELLQAIFKSKRYGEIQENFYEEIADVKIMLEQLLTEIGVTYDIYDISEYSVLKIFDTAIYSILEVVSYTYEGDNLETYIFTDFTRRGNWVKLLSFVEYYYSQNQKVRDYYNQKIERLKKIVEGK